MDPDQRRDEKFCPQISIAALTAEGQVHSFFLPVGLAMKTIDIPTILQQQPHQEAQRSGFANSFVPANADMVTNVVSYMYNHDKLLPDMIFATTTRNNSYTKRPFWSLNKIDNIF